MNCLHALLPGDIFWFKEELWTHGGYFEHGSLCVRATHFLTGEEFIIFSDHTIIHEFNFRYSE